MYTLTIPRWLQSEVSKKIALSDRNAAVDWFRAFAILVVMGFHSPLKDHSLLFRYGYLGVDLFFVISGFLVSRPLILGFLAQKRASFGKFFVRRAFKIWPSYYFMLSLGSLLTLIVPINPIDKNHVFSYVFFYQNFSSPRPSSFDMVWSICIEEHFYIILPVFFIIAGKLLNYRVHMMIIGILSMIFGTVLLRFLGYELGKTVWGNTQYRLDGLGLGVLLSTVQVLRPQIFFGTKIKTSLIIVGLLLIVFGVLFSEISNFFDVVLKYFFVSLGFALVIAGSLSSNFRYGRPLQLVAYFSYNIYLWHNLMGAVAFKINTPLIIQLFIYVGLTAVAAHLATVLVEETTLRYRELFLSRLFQSQYLERKSH